MSESADKLVGAVLEDRYRVLRKIGEGGMGSVYEAEHLRIGRRMAIKTLQGDYAEHHELVTRFEREAFAAPASSPRRAPRWARPPTWRPSKCAAAMTSTRGSMSTRSACCSTRC